MNSLIAEEKNVYGSGVGVAIPRYKNHDRTIKNENFLRKKDNVTWREDSATTKKKQLLFNN